VGARGEPGSPSDRGGRIGSSLERRQSAGPVTGAESPSALVVFSPVVPLGVILLPPLRSSRRGIDEGISRSRLSATPSTPSNAQIRPCWGAGRDSNPVTLPGRRYSGKGPSQPPPPFPAMLLPATTPRRRAGFPAGMGRGFATGGSRLVSPRGRRSLPACPTRPFASPALCPSPTRLSASPSTPSAAD